MAAKNPTPTKRSRRASQRLPVRIDLASNPLKALMVEQCRGDVGSFMTVYRGSAGELLAAGVPEGVLAPDGAERAFRIETINVCCTGSHETLDGITRGVAGGFELEVDWGHVTPYLQGSHMVVHELARMVLKDVLWWADTGPYGAPQRSLAQSVERLAADDRSEYKPAADAPRFQLSPAFLNALGNKASELHHWVHSNCEVMLVPSADAVPAADGRPALRMVTGAAHG